MNNQINYKRNELLGKHNRRLRRIKILTEQYKKGLISYEEYSQRYDFITKLLVNLDFGGFLKYIKKTIVLQNNNSITQPVKNA